MRVSYWMGGLLIALAGCSGFDRTYTPPSRGSMVSDRTLQLPPGNVSSWQNAGRGSPAAYRTPTGSAGFPGGLASSNTTGSPTSSGSASAEPFRGSAALAQQPAPQFGAGATLGGGMPGQAVPEAKPTATTVASHPADEGFSPIQQVGHEERPLRVVPPESLSRGPLSQTPAASPPFTEPPRPLLMATESNEKPQADESLTRRRPRSETTQPENSHESPSSSSKPFTELPTQPLPVIAKDSDVGPLPEKGDETPTVPTPSGVKADERPAQAGSPAVRMVNSKRIVLNYELKDVGPSGVSSIELWYTRDGRTWQKDETPDRQKPPYVFEVPEEGMYGFSFVAKNGVGLGKQPPQPGDLPQVWVEVDLTRPAVSLVDVKHGKGNQAREVTVTWNAHDRNLSRRPITVFWSEKADGPWLPVAANIENTGKHTWSIPPTGPISFFTRIEAVDMVGNVGAAQTSKATSIDTSQPTVSILGVESADR